MIKLKIALFSYKSFHNTVFTPQSFQNMYIIESKLQTSAQNEATPPAVRVNEFAAPS